MSLGNEFIACTLIGSFNYKDTAGQTYTPPPNNKHKKSLFFTHGARKHRRLRKTSTPHELKRNCLSWVIKPTLRNEHVTKHILPVKPYCNANKS